MKLKGGGITEETCIALTEEDYQNIDKYIKESDALFKGIDVKSVDCKSSYLKLGAIALIFLLF